jgi:hypothetical protein
MPHPPPPHFEWHFLNLLAEKTRKNTGGKSREKNEIKIRHVHALFCELAQLYLLFQKKKLVGEKNLSPIESIIGAKTRRRERRTHTFISRSLIPLWEHQAVKRARGGKRVDWLLVCSRGIAWNACYRAIFLYLAVIHSLVLEYY